MKIPYFFKAKSRIGLRNKPIHQKQLNLGVEDGSDGILTPEFLKKFKNFEVSEYIFPNPEDIENKDFDIVLAKHLLEFKNQILKQVQAFGSEAQVFDSEVAQTRGARRDDTLGVEAQIVIGGDHSVTFSSILAVLERINDSKDFGYIQFDSHGDMNLAKDSPTQNFHGMYLRPFLDNFDILEIGKLVKKKLKSENMLFIGNLDLDPKERKFFERKKIRNIDREEIISNKTQVTSYFKKFINQFKYLHISFDIDGMDKSVAPATGIPAENGLFKEDVFPFLEILKSHSNFSFDLCEVNPKKKGAERTIKLAQKILLTILKSHS